jgi:citrate synthase
VSFDGFFAKNKNDNSHEVNLKKAIALTAKIPGIVAGYSRARNGQQILDPDSKLSHAENFLYMLSGKKPTVHETKAMDCALVLHADHGFNASTFSARVTIATLSDMHSAITSAIGTLKGPLHGGANTEVMLMLEKIGDISKVDAHIKNLFEKKQKIMGFGHRVYRTTDPRVIHLKNLSKNLCENSDNKQLKMYYALSQKIEKLVMDIKGLNSNVDFYTASLYHALGIPTDMFTTLFVISRVSGWTAHVLEQLKANRLIRPQCEYTGPMGLKI